MKKHRILISGLVVTYTLLFSSCNLIIKTPEAIAKQIVATVGKNKITRGDIDNSYEFAETKMYVEQYMGATLDPETDLNSYFQYKSMALSDMVDAETAIVEAENQNISVDQTKLKEAVDKDINDFKNNFMTNGTLDQASYDNYFKSLGITEQTYTNFTERTHKVSLIWDELLKDVAAPTDDEVKADYDKNKETYEKDYNKLDTNHILISTQDDKRTDDEALALANEIKAKLDAGADFAGLVNEYSDDTASKESGGAVGDMTFGSLDSGYVDGAKALSPGQISGPIKSQYGYHIIKLNSITLDGDSFDKMKSIVYDKLYQGKKDEEKKTRLEKYKNDLPVVTLKYQNNLINFR